MNKRIFRACFLTAVSASVTLLFMFCIYLPIRPTGSLKLVFLLLTVAAVSAATAVTASRLAKVLSKELSDRLNSISPAYPNDSDTTEEFKPLIHKMNAHNERFGEQISSLELSHREQDEMRREFTANVSHELKTPLTSISGYAEIIRDGIAKGEDISRFAGKICDESGRLITLVGDIIKLSQLDGDDLSSVKTEDIDLYSLTEGIISHLEHAASKKNVKIILKGEHVNIKGAEQIADEIIFNICDNAVKYNKENGRVDITIRQCLDGVELTVSDTGIGIAKEDIDHVFERFYRADKSHSKEIGGTGLGLSIVKHGVKFMSASVTLESELNKGTTVRVLF